MARSTRATAIGEELMDLAVRRDAVFARHQPTHTHDIDEREQPAATGRAAARTLRRLAVSGALAGALLVAALVGANPALAAYTAKVQNGTLTVTGDSASDKLALRLGSPTTLQVDVGEDGTADFTFDRGTFTAIDVEAGGGDDEVRVDQSGGTFTDEAVTMNGGAGNDTLIGASGADTILGGGGNDFADGNQGADTASLGGGSDRFQWDPGDGSDTVDGQAGDDTLDFNGSNIGEQVDVTANGGRVRFTRNVAAITMDLDGLEHIGFRALGGADVVTVGDLTGTDAKTVDVDLDAIGGVGDGSVDTVTALGTDGADKATFSNADDRIVAGYGTGAQTRVTGGEPADGLVLATLGGADTATMAVGITAPLALHVDGGADLDTVRYNGTTGDDEIGIARNGTEVATFSTGTALLDTTVESLVVSGLAGNDTVTGQNGIGTLTSLTLDGGDGDDILRGGDGADLLLGGRGNDLVDGNIGIDTATLGAGDDHFQWDPGDGSDFVDGQGGRDQLDFNGSNAGEKIELSADGPRLRLTRDIAAITMSTDGIETAAIRTLGAADTVTVDDLTGTDVGLVDVDLNAFDGAGDGAADTVVARGTDETDSVTFTSPDGRPVVNGLGAQTRVTGGEPALDGVVAQTLGGADTATLTVGVASAIPLHVDGGDGADTVRYTGTAGDDEIGIARNGTEVATFAAGTALLDTTVESLVVSGLGGNDTITGQNGIGTLTALTLDGGDGDDTLRGGDGADLLLGGKGDDLADGNIGADTATLGAGNDRFQWDPGDGSDVVDGQSGDDTLAFNGSNIGEQIALAANGTRVRLTRNVAAITMDVGGFESAAIRTLGGADTVEVGDLTGTGLKTVDLDLAATGGGGDASADTVIVDGTARRDVVGVTSTGAQVAVAGLPALTRIAGSEPANDTLVVRTLAGNDDVTVAADVATLIATTVDLGADE